MIWWIAGCAVIALLLYIGVTFNELVAERNQVRAAWADIDVQLQRRHDLVPQLAATVKGYAEHERSTLSAVTELRTSNSRPGWGLMTLLTTGVNQNGAPVISFSSTTFVECRPEQA